LRQFNAAIDAAMHFQLEDRRDRAMDMRAAASTDESFNSYLRTLDPKDRDVDNNG
jgi:hypothetical protein